MKQPPTRHSPDAHGANGTYDVCGGLRVTAATWTGPLAVTRITKLRRATRRNHCLDIGGPRARKPGRRLGGTERGRRTTQNYMFPKSEATRPAMQALSPL